jgi:hypothetical protein
MANHFYRARVDQHLRIGMRALELLREAGVDQLHSRKLRSLCGGGVSVRGLKHRNNWMPRPIILPSLIKQFKKFSFI